MVLVHSDGNDLRIIEQLGTLDALAELKQRGLIRAFGMSTKTVEGGLAAARESDAVMLTYNLAQREGTWCWMPAPASGRAALIKKALASGHLAGHEAGPGAGQPGTWCWDIRATAAIIGTITIRRTWRAM